ncbi:MAG: hypothetical protein MJ252_10800 [archaeon]|nr:hypothetical protein [archaeon]
MKCFTIQKNIKIFFFFSLFSFIISKEVSHKLFQMDSVPDNIIWCGPSKRDIFVLTQTNSVYKSSDKGFSWKNLTPTFMEKATQELGKEEGKIGKVTTMLHSPVDKSLIVFLGNEGFSWYIEGCGENIRALFQGRPINEYIFHPTERNWGLASAYSLCEDYVGEPCRIVKELYVTQNLGDDWKILGDYINQFAWGILNENMIKAGIPKERIIVTYQPKGRGHQKEDKKWNYKIDLVYSDDFFQTKIVGNRKGNRFLLTDKYLYVSQLVDQETQEVQLLHSSATNKVYEFTPIITNQEKFKQHSFSFLVTKEDVVFLYINNYGEGIKYGNVYSSGDQGKYFSLSLKHNLQVYENENDFENVKSTEGVFLANAVSSRYMREIQGQIQNAANKAMDNKKSSNEKLNIKNNIKTMITMNKGGDWRRLKAPAEDSNGKEYDCGENCYLHLYGYSSEIPQFYSVDSAPGLIIGNGMVGRYLDFTYKNVALFLTRNGGLSWFEIKKGTYIYEIGDHGGLIVIAPFEKATDTISYSYDEGITWTDLEISDVKFRITNILIEPSASAQNFLVYGFIDKEGYKKGITIAVDFSSLQMPVCKKSDYEIWTPKSSNNVNECLLGRKISYSRRKRESQCLNGEGFERKVTVELCACTEDDYQCDIGYHRVEPGDPCTPIRKGDTLTSNKPPENCVGYYTISRGYRKVAGDYCKGGEKYDPIKIACPYSLFGFLFKGLVYIIIICLLILLIYVVFINKAWNIKDYFSGFGDFLRYKIPESYLNIDNVDEDNTLFGNEDITAKPLDEEEKKTEDKKEEEKKEEISSDDEIPVINSTK